MVWNAFVCLYVWNRSGRFSSLQVRSLWSRQRSHPLSVSTCAGKPRLHERIAEGAQPAVEGAAAQASGRSDVLQTCLLISQTSQHADYTLVCNHSTWLSVLLDPFCCGGIKTFFSAALNHISLWKCFNFICLFKEIVLPLETDGLKHCYNRKQHKVAPLCPNHQSV